MKGWQRGDWFDATGLTWTNPSPNLRSLRAAILYPALGLIETTNISVGRGTDTPFEYVGAPWIDGPALARALNARFLPGVRFVPVDFTPQSPYPYADQLCHGIELIVTDRNVLDSPELGLEIASQFHKLFGDKFQLNKIDTLLANRSVLEALQAGRDPQRIAEDWQEQLHDFDSQAKALSALLTAVCVITKPDGCPTFASAYAGRKRWAKPNNSISSVPTGNPGYLIASAFLPPPFPTKIPLRFPEIARAIPRKPRYSLDGKSHDLTRAWQKSTHKQAV